MFTDAAVHELIGRTVIVGLDRLDEDGVWLGRDQYYGTITDGSRTGGVKIQTSSGEVITLPPDLRPYFGASGAYRLNSPGSTGDTGEVAVKPDLQTTWSQTQRAD